MSAPIEKCSLSAKLGATARWTASDEDARFQPAAPATWNRGVSWAFAPAAALASNSVLRIVLFMPPISAAAAGESRKRASETPKIFQGRGSYTGPIAWDDAGA